MSLAAAIPAKALPMSGPNHIAIIMDGNGRWAEARHLPRKMGHQRGADALKRTIEACHQAGVKYLTVYAFSAENWRRPEEEVSDLMELLRFYLRREVESLNKNEIRLCFIGDRAALSSDIREEITRAEQLTANNQKLVLTIALSYGSRQELMRAIAGMAKEIASGHITPDEVDEYTVLAHLDTSHLPDPDLLIRTGGEQRLSNFLLWQSAYAELYFTDVLWPDFSATDLNAAIADYTGRERRFGTRHA